MNRIEDWVDLAFYQGTTLVTVKIKRSSLAKYGGLSEKFLDKNRHIINKFRKGEISLYNFKKKLFKDLEKR